MDIKILTLFLLIAIDGSFGDPNNVYYPFDPDDPYDCCPAHDVSDCGPTPNVIGGGYQINQGPYNTYAKLVCEDGMEPQPESTLICNCDNRWSQDNCSQCVGELSGTRFIVVFLKATRKNPGRAVFREIYVTAKEETQVNFTVPYLNAFYSHTINSYLSRRFPKFLTLNENNVTNYKVVIIDSSRPINVYVQSYRVVGLQVGMDQYLARPIDYLSNSYQCISNRYTNQIAIASVSTEDTYCEVRTQIGALWEAVSIPSYNVWTRFSEPDDELEDYTGFRIWCDKEVAAWSGFYFATSPEDVEYGSSDAGFVQLGPTSEYSYVCVTGPYDVPEFSVKIVSQEDGTVVHINDGDDDYYDLTVHLNNNEYEFIYNDKGTPLVLVSNCPVGVFSISTTASRINNGQSDPCMHQCTDPYYWLNAYHFPLPRRRFKTCTMRIIVPSRNADDILIFGLPITADDYLPARVPYGTEYTILYFYLPPIPGKVHVHSISGAKFSCEIFCIRRVGQICSVCGRNFKIG